MGRGDLLQIISEPEAAATYALDALNPHDVKIGDTFVLCDAGGGTADLISYIVSGSTKPPEELEASVEVPTSIVSSSNSLSPSSDRMRDGMTMLLRR